MHASYIYEQCAPCSTATANMPEAVCKWFDAKKGFGFAAPKDGGEDVFVHQSHINMDEFRTMQAGQTCSYELSTDDKGRQKAINIVPH